MTRIFIILLVIFNCTAAVAQNDLPYIPRIKVIPIPKKANTIIISDSLSKDQFYYTITDILFESGYGILTADKEQGSITTNEKSFRDGVVKLQFLIKDNRVTLRGDFDDNITGDIGGVSVPPSWSIIENQDQKNSPVKDAWDEMVKIANQIPGEKEFLIK